MLKGSRDDCIAQRERSKPRGSHSALIFGCRALKVRKCYSLNYITP